ncbi:unnamed protein product, partial [Heligmosomoides polygyrus]
DEYADERAEFCVSKKRKRTREVVRQGFEFVEHSEADLPTRAIGSRPSESDLVGEQTQVDIQLLGMKKKALLDTGSQVVKWRLIDWAHFCMGRVPITKWLPTYNWKQDLKSDVIGGVMLSIMSLPQGLAYGYLVGVPPVYGLITAIFGPIIYSIFGTSRHTSPGVTPLSGSSLSIYIVFLQGCFAIAALMVGGVVEQFGSSPSPATAHGNTTEHPKICCKLASAAVPPDQAVNVASSVTLIIGLWQIFFGLLNAGILAVWLSDHLVQASWMLLYAADVMLACEDKIELQRQEQAWCDRLDRFGTNINVKRIEYLTADEDESSSIKVNGIELPRTSVFKYLGSAIASDGGLLVKAISRLSDNQCGFVAGCGTIDAINATRLLVEKHREKQKQVHIAFLDLEKVFDRVPRKVIWYALQQHNALEELIEWVQMLYPCPKSRVQAATGTSMEFPMSVGVHQGSALSPFLFVAVMDAITRGLQKPVSWTLLYADDVILACEDKDDPERQVQALCDRLTMFGLILNSKKTEYLTTDIDESGSIKIDGTEYFEHLKSEIYRAVVRPVATYGAECWLGTKEVETRLSIMETKMLRWTAGVTRMDRIRNDVIRQKFGVAPITEKMREARLR